MKDKDKDMCTVLFCVQLMSCEPGHVHGIDNVNVAVILLFTSMRLNHILSFLVAALVSSVVASTRNPTCLLRN